MEGNHEGILLRENAIVTGRLLSESDVCYKIPR